MRIFWPKKEASSNIFFSKTKKKLSRKILTIDSKHANQFPAKLDSVFLYKRNTCLVKGPLKKLNNNKVPAIPIKIILNN
jgi:hypothetical protein